MEDQHTAIFVLENVGDDNVIWTSYFSIPLNSPVLEAYEMELEDDGDNDGFLDPGEMALVTIPVYNTGHADAPNVLASLTCSNENIEITDVQFEFEQVEADSYVAAVFFLSASEDIAVGTPIILNFSAVCGEYEDYQAQYNFVHTVGLISESFETGDFFQFRLAV